MPRAEDQDLIERFSISATRESAFTELVKTYQQQLYAHIRRMVHTHDAANDVLQNVFIKVWKHLDNFREDAKLSTWLYRIAVNESLSFLEQENRRKIINASPSDRETASALHAGPSAADIEQKLQQAINTLPAKQRAVFLLRYYDEMSYEEMSRVLTTSEGALKASYHHAVKKIEAFVLRD